MIVEDGRVHYLQLRKELEEMALGRNGSVVDYSLGQEAPPVAKEGDLDIMRVLDDTNRKGHVGGTIVLGDNGEDEEDEWLGLDSLKAHVFIQRFCTFKPKAYCEQRLGVS